MNNEEKWKIRARRAQDVSVGPDGFEGITEGQVRQFQTEFKQEFCSLCIHLNTDTGEFREKGHQNDPQDCKFHWTDIVGQCWNYRPRAVAQGPAYTEELRGSTDICGT